MVHKPFLTLLCIFLFGISFSQSKDPADFSQGVKLYKEARYKEAIPFFEKSINAFKRIEKTDSLGLANCYNYIGLCYYMNLNLQAALDNYCKSRDLYTNINSLDNTVVVMKNITLTHHKAREKNIVLKTVTFDSTSTEEKYISIIHVNSLTKDSAIVTINEGKQDGIYLGSTGNLLSSYAVGDKPGREPNVFLGSVKIIELSDYSAKAEVHFYKKYTGVDVFPKDLLSLYTYPAAGAINSVFYEMARLKVLFVDNNREEIISREEILYNKDPNLENILMKLYTKEINDFYPDIKNYDTLPNFITPYTKGKFKGITLIESFKVTTSLDLNSFFNFVKTFPGKYIGTNWKINETYATWVLNEALQGQNNREWLLPIIEKTQYSDLDHFIRDAGYYISYDSLYLWTSRLTELQTSKNVVDAEQLCDKLIYIAKKLNDTRAENEFYYSRSYINDLKGNKLMAIEDARRAYKSDTTSINYMYGLASYYGKNEYYDSCFALYDKLLKLLPGNANIQGNYGWYKITAGRVDEAVPLCRSAYYGNRSSVAFAVNYGHTFLLKGNIDSARYYYKIMLENLQTPSDYYDGPKKDFEFFFTKGWQRKFAAEIADSLDTEFNDKYYAITEGNLVWGNARKYYDNNKYQPAIDTWKKYISLFDKVKEPPYASIHNAMNWIGLSFENARIYDSAIVYYKTANQFAQQYLVKERNIYTTSDNDFIVNNYKRMYNYYLTIKDEARAQEYKTLYEAEKDKVTELFTTLRLHFICLSGNSGTMSYSDKSNAKLLYENLVKISHITDSSNKNKLLDGGSMTRDKILNSIEQIRKSSRPEDVFIFYYSGISLNEKENSYISFNKSDSVNGRMNLDELMNNIDMVYARKKMIIMDKPNPALLSKIASKYTSSGNTASEIIFVCPGVETPVQKNDCSLFTNELVNTMNELQKKGKYSAKDFIDQASYTIGRGQYYLPVLSFTSGKDFLIFENKTSDESGGQPVTAIRGVKINMGNDKEEVNTGGPQRNYALIFATDDYIEWPKLTNPIYDARSVANILNNEFNFSTELIENASLEEIKNKLQEYWAKNYGTNDQLFIFFAGHGSYWEKAKMGYLVAKDSKMNDPNKTTYFSYNDLGGLYLKMINCKRIFLVLDACFAGTFFEQSSFRGSPEQIAAEKLEQLKNTAANKAFHKGISSGGKQYVEDGKPGQHSPFAQSFLNTLGNIAIRKNFVTADEIIGELKSNPPASTAICEGNFQYSDPFSHFIFEWASPEKTSNIKEKKLDKKFH